MFVYSSTRIRRVFLPTLVTMTVRHSFGWVNSGSNLCNAATNSSGALMGQNDYMYCDVGCATVSIIVGSTNMYCTTYSAGDSTMGYKSYNITFPSNTKEEIVYANWVQLSNGQTRWWSVLAKIDTSLRSDIGVINTPFGVLEQYIGESLFLLLF